MGRSVRKFKESVEMQTTLFHRLRHHRYVPMAVVGAALAAAACLHIWQRVTVIELAKDVSHLRVENRELTDQLKKVYSDISSLSMASRIETYAMDSLGMIRVPPERQYTLVPKNEIEITTDEFAAMVSSIKRVADFLPISSEAKASSHELNPPNFERLEDREAGR